MFFFCHFYYRVGMLLCYFFLNMFSMFVLFSFYFFPPGLCFWFPLNYTVRYVIFYRRDFCWLSLLQGQAAIALLFLQTFPYFVHNFVWYPDILVNPSSGVVVMLLYVWCDSYLQAAVYCLRDRSYHPWKLRLQRHHHPLNSLLIC